MYVHKPNFIGFSKILSQTTYIWVLNQNPSHYSNATSGNFQCEILHQTVKCIMSLCNLPRLHKNQFWFSDEPFSVQTNIEYEIRF